MPSSARPGCGSTPSRLVRHTHRAPPRRPTCSPPWPMPAHYGALTSPATSPKPSATYSATPQTPSPAPCCPLTADVSQRSDSFETAIELVVLGRLVHHRGLVGRCSVLQSHRRCFAIEPNARELTR